MASVACWRWEDLRWEMSTSTRHLCLPLVKLRVLLWLDGWTVKELLPTSATSLTAAQWLECGLCVTRIRHTNLFFFFY